MFNWLKSWWITWRVWRRADDEQRRILMLGMNDYYNPDNFAEDERPEDHEQP